MTTALTRFAGLFLLVWLTGGCAALNVKHPTASLRSVNIPAVTADGMTVNFDIAVQNPNAFELPLSQANYKLGLGGVQVVDDSLKPASSIPANGQQPVTVPVHLSFQSLLSAEQALATSGGNVPYTFDGGLDFSVSKVSMVPSLNVPLHFSGTLPLRDAFQAVARDPSVLRNPEALRLLKAVLGNSGILDNLLGR